MHERCPSGSRIPNWRYIVRRRKAEIARIAAEQWGRIRWDQLISAGVHKSQISDWVADGYLHPIHPRVYAVGHTSSSVEADLVAAVFYAGPGAMLSHETAAWWWRLTDREPRAIDVSTPRKCVPLPRRGSKRGVRVHGRRRTERVWHRRLPVTTVPQTLLDFASVVPLRRVRHALAEADYQRLLRYDAVKEIWREQRVIIELDGKQGHGTAAQIAHDHERDLRLRAAGFAVLRYTWGQITRRRELIVADLRQALALR